MLTEDSYKSARTPLIAFPGISERHAWPKADASRCCIFEAVELIGSAMFGSEWTGSELLAFNWPEEPQKIEEAWQAFRVLPRRITRATAPIRTLDNRSSPTALRGSAVIQPTEPKRHVDQYRARLAAIERSQAVSAEQDKWEENRKQLERLAATMRWLAEQCRNSKIASFVRFDLGGILFEMHHWEWNVDDPVSHFLVRGGFDRFFKENPERLFAVYIFLDRQSLDTALSAFKNADARVPVVNLSQVSPYLQFALQLALKHGYKSPKGTDKVAVREQLVRDDWKEALPDVPMTAAQVEMIARIIGFPDREAIRHGTRSTEKKTG